MAEAVQQITGEGQAHNAVLHRALDALSAAHRDCASGALEQALIDLRIAGFAETAWPSPGQPSHRPRARVANGQLAEIQASDLGAEALADGVLGGGGLIVRGLMDARRVAAMRGHIDAALAARKAWQENDGTSPDTRSFRRSPQVKGGPQQFWARNDSERYTDFGSVWAADSPAAAQFMAQFYREIGLPGLLHSCLGEEAVLSVKKWVLRKVKPKTGGQSGWHQDGKFLGQGINTINLWIALSECGGESAAPGMEIVADHRKHIHETGTRGAMFDWVVGPELVDDLAHETPVLIPHFQPGDALFFDHYNLHRTQCSEHQTQMRYAVESWFFAASTAPAKQMPLLL